MNPSADNTWKNAGHRMSYVMVVASKVISRNVARSQVTSQKMILSRQNQSSSTGTGKMNFASTLPQTEAEFFDEKGLLKEYNPQVQQQHTGSMFILKKIQDPNNAILLSEDGVEIQHNTLYFSFRSRSCSNPISRFPIPRISAHGSSKPISNRLLQHFRYVRSKRMQ